MSYDFYLCRVGPDEDAKAAVDAMIARLDNEDNTDDVFSQMQEEMWTRPGPSPLTQVPGSPRLHLAQVLLAHDPRLQSFPLGPCIGLDGPVDGPGISLELYDDHVAVTLPYGKNSHEADSAFSEVWSLLRLLHSQGYVTYDPQLDRIVDLAHDQPQVLSRYIGT